MHRTVVAYYRCVLREIFVLLHVSWMRFSAFTWRKFYVRIQNCCVSHVSTSPGQTQTIDQTEQTSGFKDCLDPYSLDCCGSVVDHDL